ncbi:Peptidase_C39 like family protein [Clostridium cavendishii DSM 21758]|uniref:Peptidase_C39 like family protein n=1 Tax=Clostridium cavendishii DSM 21758 TaxID=1121302 RepID=A0A1M6SFX1_9CLOT|nr:cysteine peptidase family C39 domain-containing protein [Clostridium cavendishii]SHK43631.1 Peptidase_C39 like family protein [Clostridium cavendishii DSM 21758]
MGTEIDNIENSEINIDSYNHFVPVPLCYQETLYTCGVACVQSILASYGIIYHQDVLIESLQQKPIFGTDYHNIISFMQKLGFQASFNIDMNINIVKSYIDNMITPILLIQAWKDDNIDYNFDWKDNHYVIACGYDDYRIIFMDPFTLGNYTYISNTELIKRWHAIDQFGNHNYFSGLIIKNDNLPIIYKPCVIKHQD